MSDEATIQYLARQLAALEEENRKLKAQIESKPRTRKLTPSQQAEKEQKERSDRWALLQHARNHEQACKRFAGEIAEIRKAKPEFRPTEPDESWLSEQP